MTNMKMRMMTMVMKTKVWVRARLPRTLHRVGCVLCDGHAVGGSSCGLWYRHHTYRVCNMIRFSNCLEAFRSEHILKKYV